MEQTDKYAEALAAFRHLLEIMDELREKCPWDRAQTFETLRNLTVEETFELADAIMDKDYPDMCKELGDLQLHIVFYAKVASEMGLFNVTDVLNKLCDKLIRRHPHIYGEMKADSANEVHENWEKIKDLCKATIRCIPFNNPKEEGKCILTGKPSHERVLFARAY